MSISANRALSESEKYQSVLDWVNHAGPENFADLKTISAAVQLIQGSQERLRAPASLHDVIEKIDELGIEHRSSVVSGIDAKILELSMAVLAMASPQESIPETQSLARKRASMDSAESELEEGCAQPPLKKSKPTSIEDLEGEPLQMVVNLLDPQSQGKFAEANTMCRKAVHLERTYNLDRFLKHQDLQNLLLFFLQHPPSVEMERNSTNWSLFLGPGSELSEVVKTIRQCVLESKQWSDAMSEEEKTPFRDKSIQDIVSDAPLLYSLLKTEYDRNLVILSDGIYGEAKPNLSNIPTLREKTEAVLENLKEHGESITEIFHFGTWKGFSVNLTCIPQEICNLPHLHHLSIDDGKLLRVVPACIGDLKELTSLNLESNQISSLPTTIGGLCALQNLGLRMNRLTSLPDSIVSLSALTSLSLSDNHLSCLPDRIGSLSALQHLSLDGNHLSSIPDSIASLTALELLYLGQNQLTSFPDSIASLSALHHLDLSQNQLTSFPDSIASSITSLTALHHLDLSQNQLTSLPGTIGLLSRLERLLISQNQLSSLPDSVGFLPALTCLHLSNNHLSFIPDSITSLTTLHHLDLSQNQLTSLPGTIGLLSRLESLRISQNQLSSLPDSVGSLSALYHLDLCQNQLTSLPTTFGSLTALRWLGLCQNHLSLLPATFGSLTALTSLGLDHNPLSSLPDFSIFFPALEFLDLDRILLQSLSRKAIDRILTIQKLWIDGEPCFYRSEVLRRI